jgi:hypothetical protein
MKQKGQSSFELLIVTAFLLFVFIGFSFILQQNQNDKEYERTNLLLNGILNDVEEEINLARYSDDGYQREFKLPSSIYGREYNLSIIENILQIQTLDERFSSAINIPEVNGQLNIGKNSISKINGEVFLNE